MRLADQLFAGEAADLDEGGIGIENPAFGVSARDEVLILTQLGFHIVDGKVHSHSQSPVASYGEERFHDGKHAGPRDAQACPRLVRESEMPSCTAFRRRNLFHRLSPGVTAINGYFFENLTCAESNYRHFPVLGNPAIRARHAVPAHARHHSARQRDNGGAPGPGTCRRCLLPRTREHAGVAVASVLRQGRGGTAAELVRRHLDDLAGVDLEHRHRLGQALRLFLQRARGGSRLPPAPRSAASPRPSATPRGSPGRCRWTALPTPPRSRP